MAKRRETESRSARRVDATGEHKLESNSQRGLLGLSAVRAKEKRKSGYSTRARGSIYWASKCSRASRSGTLEAEMNPSVGVSSSRMKKMADEKESAQSRIVA